MNVERRKAPLSARFWSRLHVVSPMELAVMGAQQWRGGTRPVLALHSLSSSSPSPQDDTGNRLRAFLWPPIPSLVPGLCLRRTIGHTAHDALARCRPDERQSALQLRLETIPSLSPKPLRRLPRTWYRGGHSCCDPYDGSGPRLAASDHVGHTEAAHDARTLLLECRDLTTSAPLRHPKRAAAAGCSAGSTCSRAR